MGIPITKYLQNIQDVLPRISYFKGLGFFSQFGFLLILRLIIKSVQNFLIKYTTQANVLQSRVLINDFTQSENHDKEF